MSTINAKVLKKNTVQREVLKYVLGISRVTSSGVSLVSGWPCAARRAVAPARMLLRLI